MTSNIQKWLDDLGCGKYGKVFAENEIDLDALAYLTDDDLREIGVSLGARRKILGTLAVGHVAEAEKRAEPEEIADRREVSVLFADLEGFSSLAESLGPESTRNLLNRFFSNVDEVVTTYGGVIDKHIGDGVMALFGAPIARDRDPERAVRAAIDIHRTMDSLSQEQTLPLKAHVGIASGQVVAAGTGSDVHREYTVVGASVNLASRLQDLATGGETLISSAMKRAVEDAFVTASVGEVAVRGIDQPVAVWRVIGPRGDEPIESNKGFVGRRRELRQLQGFLEDASSESTGGVAVIRGEAGIGKSRLAGEIARIAQDMGCEVQRAEALDFGAVRGHEVLRTLLYGFLAVSNTDSEALRLAAAQGALSRLRLPKDQQVFLNDLLDLPQPRKLRDLYHAMDNSARNTGKRAILGALARDRCMERPLVLIVEDVHWADAITMEALADLAAQLSAERVLILLTTRIDSDPLDRTWRDRARPASLTTIDLAPMSKDEAKALATPFGLRHDDYVLECIRRAGGNPLFLEQLLLEGEAAQGERVPGSIQSIVLSRTDRLPQSDRSALQVASVIGQRFRPELVGKLIGHPEYAFDRLVAESLVVKAGDELRFAHALIRDSVYQSLLKERRFELHARIARLIDKDEPALVAAHLERAEDELAPRAYFDAAQTERVKFRSDRALALVERGIRIAKSHDDKFQLVSLQGELMLELGSTTEADSAYNHSLDLAENAREYCAAWLGLASVMRLTDRYDDAFDLIDKTESTAEENDFKSELAEARHLRGSIHFPLGQIDACLAAHASALEIAKSIDDPALQARALSGMSDAEFIRGRLLTADAYLSRCLDICRDNGLGRIEVANYAQLSYIQHYFRPLDECLELSLDAIAKAERIKDTRAELIARLGIVEDLYDLRRLEEASLHLERVSELEQMLGATRFQGRRLMYEALVQENCGNSEHARAVLELALSACQRAGMSYCGPMVLAEMARLEPDRDIQLKLLQEGEHLLALGSMSRNHFWFRRLAIDVAIAGRDPEEASRHAEALADFTRAEPLPWTDQYILLGQKFARDRT